MTKHKRPNAIASGLPCHLMLHTFPSKNKHWLRVREREKTHNTYTFLFLALKFGSYETDTNTNIPCPSSIIMHTVILDTELLHSLYILNFLIFRLIFMWFFFFSLSSFFLLYRRWNYVICLLNMRFFYTQIQLSTAKC